MSTDSVERPLRVGIMTDGLDEQRRNGRAEIANGGVGVYIYQLVKHLRLVDPASTFVTIRHGDGGLDIYSDPQQPSVILRRTPLTRVARAFDRPHARLARRLDLDILHYPNQFGGGFVPASIPRVVTLHDITPLLFPTQHPRIRVAGYHLLLRRSLHAADRVIVVSQHTGADLEAHALASRDQLRVIANGIDERFVCGEPAGAPRLALPERYILSVGVLEPRKNHVVLVRALERLHQLGERIPLIIVGRPGWHWRDPVAAANAEHLREWVQIRSNVADAEMPELYRRATVFAYPSLYEGFGLPILEAMACGTPVVTSTSSSLPDTAGGAALLVEPTDVDDLATKLLALIRDASLHQRLRLAGLRHAETFSWQRTARQTLAVYREVASRVSRSAAAGRTA